MRFILPAALLALICAIPPLAQAQGNNNNPQHLPLAQRFAMANVSHNGCLTQQEAFAGGIRWVAKNFPMIDTMGRGCVTFDQVKFAQRQRRQARMQQQMMQGGGDYNGMPPSGQPQGGTYNYQQGNQMPPDMRPGGPPPSYNQNQAQGGGAPMPGYHVGQNPGGGPGNGGPPPNYQGGPQMGPGGGPDDDDE